MKAPDDIKAGILGTDASRRSRVVDKPQLPKEKMRGTAAPEGLNEQQGRALHSSGSAVEIPKTVSKKWTQDYQGPFSNPRLKPARRASTVVPPAPPSPSPRRKRSKSPLPRRTKKR